MTQSTPGLSPQLVELWDLKKDLEQAQKSNASYYLKVEGDTGSEKVVVVQGFFGKMWASFATFCGFKSHNMDVITNVILQKLDQAGGPQNLSEKKCSLLEAKGCKAVSEVFSQSIASDAVCKNAKKEKGLVTFIQNLSMAILTQDTIDTGKVDKTLLQKKISKPEPIAAQEVVKGKTEQFIEKNRAILSSYLSPTDMKELNSQVSEDTRRKKIEEVLEKKLHEFRGTSGEDGEIGKLLSAGGSSWWLWDNEVRANAKKDYSKAREELDGCPNLIEKEENWEESCEKVATTLYKVETLLQKYGIHQKIEALPEKVAVEVKKVEVKEEPPEVQGEKEQLFEVTLQMCRGMLEKFKIDPTPKKGEDRIEALLSAVAGKNKEIRVFTSSYWDKFVKNHEDIALNKLCKLIDDPFGRHLIRMMFRPKEKESQTERLQNIQQFACLYEEIALVVLSQTDLQARRAVFLMELCAIATDEVPLISKERLLSVTTSEIQALYKTLKKDRPDLQHYFGKLDDEEQAIALDELQPHKEHLSLMREAVSSVQREKRGIEAKYLLQAEGIGSPSAEERERAKLARALTALCWLRNSTPTREELSTITKEEFFAQAQMCIQQLPVLQPGKAELQLKLWQQEIELLMNDLVT